MVNKISQLATRGAISFTIRTRRMGSHSCGAFRLGHHLPHHPGKLDGVECATSKSASEAGPAWRLLSDYAHDALPRWHQLEESSMHCCSTHSDRAELSVAAAKTTRRRFFRRVTALIQWTLPLTTLALMPKCPACVAAYVLFFTGIGLSFSAATALRWILLALSLSALVWLLVRAARRPVTQVV
jgi:hypothetical protein